MTLYWVFYQLQAHSSTTATLISTWQTGEFVGFVVPDSCFDDPHFYNCFFSLIIYLLGDVGSFSQCRLDAMYFFWLAVSKCVCVCVPCLRRGILITLRETSNPRIFYSVRHRQSSPVVLRTSKAHLDIQMVNIASSAEAKSLVRQVQQSESFVDQHPELRPVRFPGHWVCSRLCRSTSLSQLKISELAAIERCVQ